MSTRLSEKNATEEQIQERLLESKRLAASAMEYGMATMETLEAQDEMLQSVEDTLEANDHVLQKSVRALRGMTWGGYFVNKVVDVRNSIAGDPNAVTLKATKVNEKDNQPDNNKSNIKNGNSEKTQLMEFGNKAVTSEEDEQLADLSSAVEVLHKMGISLGEQIEGQNEKLERIEDKTNAVTEHTLAVTLRASQLLRNNNNSLPSFIGTYQFIDIKYGRYLSISDSDGVSLVLSEASNLSSYFHCFVKEKNLFGLLNEKTQKYVGCTVWGGVCASGNYYGTHEECFVEFPQVEDSTYREDDGSGILILYRNWGAGGWLKLDASVNTKDRTSEWAVTDTTSNVLDKNNSLQFRVIKTRVKPEANDKNVA